MDPLDFSLNGRVALVTGASSGIGHTLAKGLSRAGATVVVAARRVDRLGVLVEEIVKLDGKAYAIKMDVADRASVDEGFEEAQKSLLREICRSEATTACLACAVWILAVGARWCDAQAP